MQAASAISHQIVYLPKRKVKHSFSNFSSFSFHSLLSYWAKKGESGRDPIRVGRVVVVAVAVAVHIPEIGAVGRIRRTKPPIVCRT